MDLVGIAIVPNCVEKAGGPTRRVSKSRLQVANILLRRLHNELNLGEVLIFLEKIFFDLGCQLRCDGDFEFLARSSGALCEGIGDRLWVAAQRLFVLRQDLDLKCPSALPAQVDYEAIRQVRDPAFDDPRLLSVRASNGWRQFLSFISRSRILFPARLYPFQALSEMIADHAHKGGRHLVLCFRRKTCKSAHSEAEDRPRRGPSNKCRQ
jgi:hypothetical protein